MHARCRSRSIALKTILVRRGLVRRGLVRRGMTRTANCISYDRHIPGQSAVCQLVSTARQCQKYNGPINPALFLNQDLSLLLAHEIGKAAKKIMAVLRAG